MSHIEIPKQIRGDICRMGIYGYARVSSSGQNLEAQIKQLEEFGCGKIFKEKISGRTTDRKELQSLLGMTREGDTIVVTKLDRFARSTKDALAIIENLNARNVALVVLNMGGNIVNTGTAVGKLIVTVLAGIAEFEADMIRERQLEGIEEAKRRGAYKGRPKRYTEKHAGIAHAVELFANRSINGYTVKQICEITKIGRSSLYRKLEVERLKSVKG